MIAHFVAHTSAVVAMAFDPSGLLLITADRHGHRFNVFRIHPHPCTSQLAAVHHLYILHRFVKDCYTNFVKNRHEL